MQKNLLYVGAFIILVLLQIFLLDNISLSVFFHPMIYIAFIIMLPLDIKPLWVLLLSTLMGLTIDMLTGMSGLNVVATTATGFLRPLMLRLAVGKDNATDGGIPAPMQVGAGKFWAYASVFTAVQCALFFTLEAMTLQYLLPIVLKIVVNTIATVMLVWGVASVFAPRNYNNSF